MQQINTIKLVWNMHRAQYQRHWKRSCLARYTFENLHVNTDPKNQKSLKTFRLWLFTCVHTHIHMYIWFFVPDVYFTVYYLRTRSDKKHSNSPPCACRGSSGQKPQYGLMTLAYQLCCCWSMAVSFWVASIIVWVCFRMPLRECWNGQ
jgi:hypothetical protein